MRHCFHTEGMTDLDKFRQEARARLAGNSRDEPEETVIHYHTRQQGCQDKKHEDFVIESPTGRIMKEAIGKRL